MYVPGLAVFVIANFVQCQPCELDNPKHLYGAWILVALAIVAQFLRDQTVRPKTFVGRRLNVSWRSCPLINAGLSAFMSSVQSMFWPTSMFRIQDDKFGLWVAENAPPDPIVLFAGVRSRGIDGRRGSKQSTKHRSRSPIAMFRDNKISYIVAQQHGPESFFDPHGSPAWKPVYRDNLYKRYSQS
jgi:hypothetical protein